MTVSYKKLFYFINNLENILNGIWDFKRFFKKSVSLYEKNMPKIYVKYKYGSA